MFLIAGTCGGSAELAYSGGMNICPGCGAYCSYNVFMTYTSITLFFVPIVKAAKKYYVRTSCCGSIYKLSKEKGRILERHGETEVTPEDLSPFGKSARVCPQCGAQMQDGFDYCPKCGMKL